MKRFGAPTLRRVSRSARHLLRSIRVGRAVPNRRNRTPVEDTGARAAAWHELTIRGIYDGSLWRLNNGRCRIQIKR